MLEKAEFLQRSLVRLRDKSELRNLLASGEFLNRPSRPLPFVFFSETVLGLDCYRLSGNPEFLKLAEANVRAMLAFEDRRLALDDAFRNRPSVGWSCSYLYGWRRDPVTHEQHSERRLTNDVTTSSVIGMALLLYSLQAGASDPASAALRDEILDCLPRVASYYYGDLEDIDVGTHMVQPWQEKDEPINHVAAYAGFLILLDALRPDETVRKQALSLCRYIETFFNYDANGCLFLPYRDDRQAKRIVGERFWKSTWSTLLVALCRKRGLHFDEAQVDALLRSVNTNLIRNGEVYESLCARDGRPVTDDIVEYHRARGQHLAILRFVNFAHLEALRPGTASKIWEAALGNRFLRQGIENFDALTSTPLLEGMASYFNASDTTLTFPLVGAPAAGGISRHATENAG